MKKPGNVNTAIIAAIIIIAVFSAVKVMSEKKAKILLGGDVEISRNGEVAPLSVITFLSMNSKVRSVVATAQAEARPAEKDTPPNPKPAYVTVKVIDKTYPLYGKLDLSEMKRQRAFGIYARGSMHGAAVTPSLLEELGIKPGGHFKIGEQMFVASATIADEPDYHEQPADLPRMIISRRAFDSLLKNNPQFASEINFAYRVKLAKETDINEWREKFDALFGEQNWKASDWRDSLSPVIYGVKLSFLLVTMLALVVILVIRIAKKSAA